MFLCNYVGQYVHICNCKFNIGISDFGKNPVLFNFHLLACLACLKCPKNPQKPKDHEMSWILF